MSNRSGDLSFAAIAFWLTLNVVIAILLYFF